MKVLRIPLIIYRRLRYYYWQLINSFIFIRHNVNIGNNNIVYGLLYVRNAGNILIGSSFMANSGRDNNPIGGDTLLRLICRKGGEINIGDNCSISNSTLWANKSITIEDNVFIGGGCRIWDNDFHSLDSVERLTLSTEIISKPILIKKNSFIGGGSIILKGVVIGERSVIGAGSVVASSIPDGEIWAGNPAKYIRRAN